MRCLLLTRVISGGPVCVIIHVINTIKALCAVSFQFDLSLPSLNIRAGKHMKSASGNSCDTATSATWR